MMTTSPSKAFQFVFKPTTRCNLACSYCYAAAPGRCGQCETMSVNEARCAVDWMLSFCGEFGITDVSVLWHGGEPLLVGVDFMSDILQYVKESFSAAEIKCRQSIQTNLLLYSDRHDELIHAYFNDMIGFSYDYGSETRRYADGRCAAQDIWAAAERCKAKGFTVGAICQLTPENRCRPEAIYHHFKKAGIHFNLTPVFSTETVSDRDKALCDVKDDAAAACRVFDIWFHDDAPTIEIGNFKDMIVALLRGYGTKCCHQENCARVILTLAPGGKVLPCSRFVLDKDVVGNFLEESPAAVYEKRMSQLCQRERVECHRCPYEAICKGGCPYHDMTGWHECECHYNQVLFAHIEGRLRENGHEIREMS